MKFVKEATSQYAGALVDAKRARQTGHIEGLLGQNMQGNPTYIGRSLQKIAEIFNRNQVEFAVAGALSLGIRAKARYTSDIDVLVHPDEHDRLTTLFRESDAVILLNDEYMMTVKDVETEVEIDLLFSPFDPEESARVTASSEEMFGVNVPVIRSEFLLWMYLLSAQEKHRVDGIELIKTGNVDLEKLRQYLQYDEDEQALETLEQWVVKAEQERRKSYSESIRQRRFSKKRA